MSSYRILVVDPLPSDTEDFGDGLAAKKVHPKSLEVDPERLGEELSSLLNIAEHVSEPKESHFSLSEITIELAVTTEGKLAIFGSGVKAGAKAGITVKIVRSTDS